MTIPLTAGGWGEVSLFSPEMKGKEPFQPWFPPPDGTPNAKYRITEKTLKTNPQ